MLKNHPRSTTPLIGHRDPIKTCSELLSQDRFPHALLLQGPKGIGKTTFAYHLIRHLFSRDKNLPIMTPSREHNGLETFMEKFSKATKTSLFKRVQALGHGDLKVVERVLDDKGKLPRDISVDQIRKVVSFFALKSMEGGWRIALIDSVDEMNLQAANALLKILEEPPQKSLLILINHTPGKLLPTLSSRCQKIMFRPLTPSQTLDVLKEKLPDSADTGTFNPVTLFPGRPGKIVSLLQDPDQDLLETFSTLTKMLVTQDSFNPFPFLDKALPGRSTEKSAVFLPLAEALLEWLHTLIQEGLQGILTSPRQTLFSKKTPHEWSELYIRLSSLFQDTERLSYDPRHILLLALMKITHHKK